MDRTIDPALRGIGYSLIGAYVGAILFFVTLGITQGEENLWTRESLRDLFVFPAVGIILLSWWILPLGALFGTYFCPKLSQLPRSGAVIRGILLGAVLGLLTAAFFALLGRSSAPARTIQFSFAFFPVYCAAWCGGYSWLRARRD
jgi:hypothetical protein